MNAIPKTIAYWRTRFPFRISNLQEVPEEAFRRFQLLVERDFPAPAEEYPLVKI